jgi:hypothetical protein
MAPTPVPQSDQQTGHGQTDGSDIKKRTPESIRIQWNIHPDAATPAKPGRVAEADNLVAETKKITDTSRAINDLAKQPGAHKDEINAKRKELGGLLTKAVSDADDLQRLHGPQIQKRLDAVQADIAVKGKGLSKDQLDQLLKSPEVPADKHDLYNLLQEEYTLKSAKIAQSTMRMLYASEALKGHTDPSAPLPDRGPITSFAPSAKETSLARDLTAEATRLSSEAGRTKEIVMLSGQANVNYSQLQQKGSQDEIAKHASVVDNNLRQAKPFIDKDPGKAASFYQAANREADQINYSQIKKELADKGTSAERRQELEGAMSRSKDARLDYAQFLVNHGKPNDATIYLAKAVADGTQTENPSDPTYQSYKAIKDSAVEPPADMALIKQERDLTLNLGTQLNDPKKAAEIVPKVLKTLTGEAMDMTAAQQDMQKELQAANNKLKAGGLDAADTKRVQAEIAQLQDQQTSLNANLTQRKQELANTQYKAAVLALASQDTKTAQAMLTAAKTNDPNLFEYIKQQGGKGEETFNQLMDKTKEKSFWQQHWHAITEAGIWVGGALAVGAAVAFAPVTVVALAVVGTVALSSAAMYYAKKSAGEHATWKDAAEGGIDGLIASSGAAGKLIGVAAESVPLIGRTAAYLSKVAPRVMAAVVATSPEWLNSNKFVQPAKAAVTMATDFVKPLYESGSALYSKAPAAVRTAAEFIMPSRTAWGVGGIYGSYKFHDDVTHGQSVGQAALNFVPHAIEGALVTHGFTKSTGILGRVLETQGIATESRALSVTGQAVTKLSTGVPESLIPRTKLALGIGVPYAGFMAGYGINQGETYQQALFDAPFNLLKGAQVGQFGSRFSKQNELLHSLAVTTGRNTALSFGYTAAKHATLYGMGQENGREATGNFLEQAPFNNATLNAYDLFLNAGMKKVGGQLAKAGLQETAITPSLANMSKYAWVAPKAAFMSVGSLKTLEVGSNWYNDKGGRIDTPLFNFRPSNNPNVPLDPNRPNEERLIQEHMGSFPELDTPRRYDQDDQQQ